MEGLAYAYGSPNSADQQEFVAKRVAALAERRKRQQRRHQHQSSAQQHFQSEGWHDSSDLHSIDQEDGVLDPAVSSSDLATTTTASASRSDHSFFSTNTCESPHGRRFTRGLVYPLPCDLVELQRQTISTLLRCTVFGRPVCSPRVDEKTPSKILELGCGTGFWSATCHEWFQSRGHEHISFTGLDIIPLAPDWNDYGVDWTFVQHDFRQVPLPFDDGEFDLVMLKDLSLTSSLPSLAQRLLDESIRVTREGGIVEIQDVDHLVRVLPSLPVAPRATVTADEDLAKQTGTYLVAPGTLFEQTQNEFMQQMNDWLSNALSRRRLPPTPCARYAQMLHQEPDHLNAVGFRRIAVPLGQPQWEREFLLRHVIVDSPMREGGANSPGDLLTIEQAGIRQTAMLTLIQFLESMESHIREVNGKNSEEWSLWWSSMMTSLLGGKKGSLTGECLEVGAWWASKIGDG